MLQTIKRLTGWPWFERLSEKAPMQTGWENDPWMREPEPWMPPYFNLMTTKGKRAEYLDKTAAAIKEEIALATRHRKARKHLYAQLESLTTERLRIEGEG